MKLSVRSYIETLSRYVCSVTFCGAAVLKVMDQKHSLSADTFIRSVFCVYVVVNFLSQVDFIFLLFQLH